MKEQFKIANTGPSFGGFAFFISALVFGCGAVGSMGFMEEAPALAGTLCFTCVLLFFAAPLGIMAGLKMTVDYDGKYVRTKNLFGKGEVNLDHIETVSYHFENAGYKDTGGYIFVELEPFKTYEDEDITTLLDHVSNDQMDDLIKGDHSEVALLMMYDDIIARYPDKAEKKDKKQDAE